MKLFAIYMKTLCKMWQAEFALTEVQNECRRLAEENARLKARLEGGRHEHNGTAPSVSA